MKRLIKEIIKKYRSNIVNFLTVSLLFAGIYYGCKDNETFDDPKVAIDGITSVEPVPVGQEVTVNFKVFAPASISKLTYSIINSAGNYEIVPIPAGGATEMSVPITFKAELGMLNVTMRVTDKKGKSDEATIPITRVLDKPWIFFADNINAVDLVIIGSPFSINGVATADVDLKELYYTPFVNGIPQSPEAIPIGEDRQLVAFEIFLNTVNGMQKIEFTAIDELNREEKTSFTIKRVQSIGLVMNQSSSRLLIYGEANRIRGQVFTGSPIIEAKYFITKLGVEDEGQDLVLDEVNRFDFSIDVERGITNIRISVANAEETDEDNWEVASTGRLKYLENITLTMEQYESNHYSFFCAWKEPHVFHGSEMCNTPEEFVDWWDFSVYQRVGNQPISIASPAAWGKGVQNSDRVVHQVVPGIVGIDGNPCRGPAEGWVMPSWYTGHQASWNNVGSNVKIPRLNYTMISTVRPELETVFDRVQTEKDLWDLLDVYVESQGKTIREIYNPVGESRCQADAIAGGVYWIAWGPKNGSGKGGEKGGQAENGGLGLLRVSWESGTTPAAKQVTFDVKFPSWPNYRELYNDSWIDIRQADPRAGDGGTPLFPVGFDFTGWPELVD